MFIKLQSKVKTRKTETNRGRERKREREYTRCGNDEDVKIYFRLNNVSIIN